MIVKYKNDKKKYYYFKAYIFDSNMNGFKYKVFKNKHSTKREAYRQWRRIYFKEKIKLDNYLKTSLQTIIEDKTAIIEDDLNILEILLQDCIRIEQKIWEAIRSYQVSKHYLKTHYLPSKKMQDINEYRELTEWKKKYLDNKKVWLKDITEEINEIFNNIPYEQAKKIIKINDLLIDLLLHEKTSLEHLVDEENMYY